MDRRPIHYRLIIALDTARKEGLSESTRIKLVVSPDIRKRLEAELKAILDTEFYEGSPPYMNTYQNYAGIPWESRTDVPDDTLKLVWTVQG